VQQKVALNDKVRTEINGEFIDISSGDENE
jgi:hypothetical protein